MAKLPKELRAKQQAIKDARRRGQAGPAGGDGVGAGGAQNRAMRRQMKKQGIEGMDMIEAKRVIIETEDNLLVFNQPQVIAVSQGGIKAYQVIGEPEEMEHGSVDLGALGSDADGESVEGEEDTSAPLEVVIKPEDVQLVAMQANVSHDVAEKELKATNGDIAGAIINLMNKK